MVWGAEDAPLGQGVRGEFRRGIFTGQMPTLARAVSKKVLIARRGRGSGIGSPSAEGRGSA